MSDGQPLEDEFIPTRTVAGPCPKCRASIPVNGRTCSACDYERKFDDKQYDMLMRCSVRDDVVEWNTWREESGDPVHMEAAFLQKARLKDAQLREAHLEGARLWSADLRGARFVRAHLEGADLGSAVLHGASFLCAHLEGAMLPNAQLQGAILQEAHLEGTQFAHSALERVDATGAIVDGETYIWRCHTDRRTNFTGVGLASARVHPGNRTELERNMRQRSWAAWCHRQCGLVALPVWLFWQLTDYGGSTTRILLTFAFLSVVFAGVYYWSGLPHYPPGVPPSRTTAPRGLVADLFAVGPDGPLEQVRVPHTVVFWRALYFSVVTMTTLGFGDIHAEPGSWLGHAMLTVQVVLGYLLLGALVTRFAIMFQGASSPSLHGHRATWYLTLRYLRSRTDEDRDALRERIVCYPPVRWALRLVRCRPSRNGQEGRERRDRPSRPTGPRGAGRNE
jgi:uncharacterized protein YjbI with pentapeptide repeats